MNVKRLFAPTLFRGANMHRAHLVGANLEGGDFERANLNGANLGGANLTGANLDYANLENANLVGTNLRAAKLRRTRLLTARIRSAIMHQTDLTEADMRGADVRGADLSGANMRGADLTGADLAGVNLAGVVLGETILANIDLSPFLAAQSTTRHLAPCLVDHTSVMRSVGIPNLKQFLVRAGMPEVLVESVVNAARLLRPEIVMTRRSTFISYGHPDVEFAKRLNDALFRNGVTTFFFRDHALPGKKLHRLMRDAVNEHDRVILICSKKSLTRQGVLNEIEESLNREAAEGGADLLIPIRLDDYIFDDEFASVCKKLSKGDIVPALRRRVIGDFRGAQTDDAKFTTELLKVLAALQK